MNEAHEFHVKLKMVHEDHEFVVQKLQPFPQICFTCAALLQLSLKFLQLQRHSHSQEVCSVRGTSSKKTSICIKRKNDTFET